ncbi:MAG: bifunctional phosphopantothenoylcysteine decarboxylase/phosphopantothenate--cysteine ligase CoaBC [Actinomycetota bacterium]|nr:bifunctional phosphopantothenoylcysteine decarboxylase/phosphopantothenate--cysteine ligase CoaBC [Actinomycetota bacterium]
MVKSILEGKTVVLGVSGGIASYKAVDLASKLTQEGATVKVVMTANATKFVGSITFQAVTHQPVLTNLFEDSSQSAISHVSICKDADIFIVAPATANIIAKAAHGLADDALSTALLTASCTIVMVPAMNSQMWLNKATQHNLNVLKNRGIQIIEPEVGRLACGDEQAKGRFPETEFILNYMKDFLGKVQSLRGKTILITAGGTREPIDSVRFIGNRSSGKMGYAIAKAAKTKGANVILISGPTNLQPPFGVSMVYVETAQQMLQAVINNLSQADAVVMTAAVSDFRPAMKSNKKIKKESMPSSIELELNPDILEAISNKKDKQLVIGFAAETDNVLENATKKLKKKKLDLMVANDVSHPDFGFDSDFILAAFISDYGQQGSLEKYRKTELAEKVVEWIASKLA